MLKPHVVVFDLETTGLPSEADHIGITQIAAVVLDPNQPGWPELASFTSFLQLMDQAHRSPFAMRMHRKKGRDEAFFADQGYHPSIVYGALEEFIQANKNEHEVWLAGHNAAMFDIPLLARDMMRWGFDLNGQKGNGRMADHHPMDTAIMANDRYGLFGTGELDKVSLKPLAKFLGIPFDEDAAHDALYDVRITADILRKMKGVECLSS